MTPYHAAMVMFQCQHRRAVILVSGDFNPVFLSHLVTTSHEMLDRAVRWNETLDLLEAIVTVALGSFSLPPLGGLTKWDHTFRKRPLDQQQAVGGTASGQNQNLQFGFKTREALHELRKWFCVLRISIMIIICFFIGFVFCRCFSLNFMCRTRFQLRFFFFSINKVVLRTTIVFTWGENREALIGCLFIFYLCSMQLM